MEMRQMETIMKRFPWTMLAPILLVLMAIAGCSTLHHAETPKPQGIKNCDNMDLTNAIAGSNMECLEMLLANGADPDEVTKWGVLPLVNAIYRQNQDSIRKLIQYGANLNAKDSLGTPMLFHAIYAYAGRMSNGNHAPGEGRNKESLQIFLDNKADTSIKDQYGNSALHIAAELGNRKLIRIFLGKDLLHTVNKYGHSPIAWAASHNNYMAMKLFIDAGFDPENPANRLTVNAAVGSNCMECLELLLKQGAKVNEEDTNGQTPMQTAVIRQDEPRLALLSQYGGDPLYIDKLGNTLLHYLLRSGHYNSEKAVPVTRLLLKLGVDKARKNDSGKTAFESLPVYIQETEEELASLLSLNVSKNVKPIPK